MKICKGNTLLGISIKDQTLITVYTFRKERNTGTLKRQDAPGMESKQR